MCSPIIRLYPVAQHKAWVTILTRTKSVKLNLDIYLTIVHNDQKVSKGLISIFFIITVKIII